MAQRTYLRPADIDSMLRPKDGIERRPAINCFTGGTEKPLKPLTTPVEEESCVALILASRD